MIITRSPLRISLGGGGTDLPSYYSSRDNGFLIAAAIDKYVYITIHETFIDELIIKYSKLERVKDVEEIQHPMIREALRRLQVHNNNLEITSMADIPAGTGLGSSGSFLTALLKALHTYQKNVVNAAHLAAEACDIEIHRLKEPVGKQDQYISAFGGVTCFTFTGDDHVQVAPLKVSKEILHDLEDNLMLFFTGYSRSASTVLSEQDTKSRQNDAEMLNNLDFVRQLGYESKEALEQGKLRQFAELMNVHWEHKKKRSSSMSNGKINEWYDLGRVHGALGGKLIGAGGGGFLLFYTEDKTALRHVMLQEGLQEVRFRFDFEGTKVVAQ